MQELDKENLAAEVVVVAAVEVATVVAVHIQDLVLEAVLEAVMAAAMVATEVLVQVIAAAVVLVRNKIQDFVTSLEEAKANLKNVGKSTFFMHNKKGISN